MAVISKIDAAKNIPQGNAVVLAGPKVQEADANRLLETYEHEGPEVSYVDAKYDARFQES